MQSAIYQHNRSERVHKITYNTLIISMILSTKITINQYEIM